MHECMRECVCASVCKEVFTCVATLPTLPSHPGSMRNGFCPESVQGSPDCNPASPKINPGMSCGSVIVM